MKYGCMNINRVNNPFNHLEIMENVILAYSGHILAVLGGKASPLTRQRIFFFPPQLWTPSTNSFAYSQ